MQVWRKTAQFLLYFTPTLTVVSTSTHVLMADSLCLNIVLWFGAQVMYFFKLAKTPPYMLSWQSLHFKFIANYN